jgi:hypothetical protein
MVAKAAESEAPATEPIQEPIPDRDDKWKAKRLVFLRHLAHEGLMLDKVSRQNRRVERMEKFAATGNVSDLDAPEEATEEMGVNIGNENHYHVVQPAAQSAAVTTPASPAANGVVSKLVPLALAAGLGAAGPLAWFFSKPPTPAAPPAVTVPSESDWRLGLEVKDQP